MSNHFVYISGALTTLKDELRPAFRDFYEKLGKVCEEQGLPAYIPHLYGDPVLNKDLTPEQVDQIDRTAVMRSGLVVAYVGEPSTGTGIEIEMAFHANIHVVLLYEKEKLDKRLISRLVRGNPSVIYAIAFTDFGDAVNHLRSWLPIFMKQIADAKIPPILKPKFATVV